MGKGPRERVDPPRAELTRWEELERAASERERRLHLRGRRDSRKIGKTDVACLFDGIACESGGDDKRGPCLRRGAHFARSADRSGARDSVQLRRATTDCADSLERPVVREGDLDEFHAGVPADLGDFDRVSRVVPAEHREHRRDREALGEEVSGLGNHLVLGQ